MVYPINLTTMVHIFKTQLDKRSRGFLGMTDLRVSTFYSASPLMQFMATYNGESSTGSSFALTRDIGLLLDNKRITDYSLQAVLQSIVDGARSSVVSDQFSGLSDDELISVVKSRFIQSPCELLEWSEWLEENLTALSDAAKQVKNRPDKVENPTDKLENPTVTSNTDVSSSD